MVSEVSEMSERITVSEFARRDGCNEKLVRRAIERGRLTRGDDGKLDSALVGTQWRRSAIDGQKPRRPGQQVSEPPVAQGGVAIPAAPPASDSAQTVDESEEQRIARLANPNVTPNFATSAAREKAAMASMRELELQRQLGKVVDVDQARALFFDTHRSVRDHWLSFNTLAPMLAARLDVDPDLMSEVLTEYVHKHAAKVTDPGFELRQHA